MTKIPASRMNIDGFHVKHQCEVDQVNNGHGVESLRILI